MRPSFRSDLKGGAAAAGRNSCSFLGFGENCVLESLKLGFGKNIDYWSFVPISLKLQYWNTSNHWNFMDGGLASCSQLIPSWTGGRGRTWEVQGVEPLCLRVYLCWADRTNHPGNYLVQKVTSEAADTYKKSRHACIYIYIMYINVYIFVYNILFMQLRAIIVWCCSRPFPESWVHSGVLPQRHICRPDTSTTSAVWWSKTTNAKTRQWLVAWVFYSFTLKTSN